VNALGWPRELEGDFAEVTRALDLPPGISTLDEERLRSLDLSPAGRLAVDTMLADVSRLREHGVEVILDGIHGYTHELRPGALRTDVCSFHVDSATAEADTWLCTYHGASSEGLPNDMAVRRIDDPAARSMLLREYAGADDEAFEEWLNDHFHDLHYLPRPDAKPWSFGTWVLWRIATLHPNSRVPACIHRAPDPVPGQPRLLLIG
jgi:hypothetical protein